MNRFEVTTIILKSLPTGSLFGYSAVQASKGNMLSAAFAVAAGACFAVPVLKRTIPEVRSFIAAKKAAKLG